MTMTAPRPVRGIIPRAQKGVIYGPPGVGKTTFGAQFPGAVFLDAENGTTHLDVLRYPVDSWAAIPAIIRDLARDPGEVQTLVIDSADWVERLLIEDVLRKSQKESIEDFGYGKGHVVVGEKWREFLYSLDPLIAKGVHVVFLAHASVRKFELPDAAGAFDKWEMKLSKHSLPVLKEWADAIFFANFWVDVKAGKGGAKGKASDGKTRVLYTENSAAVEAKNRFGLAELIPMDFAEIAHCFPAKGAPAAKPVPIPPPAPVAATPASPAPAAQEPAAPAATATTAEFGDDTEAVARYLVSIGWLTQGQGLGDLSDENKAKVQRKRAGLLTAARAFAQTRAA